MLRRIIGGSFGNIVRQNSSLRLRELNGYLCLRESLNEQSAQQQIQRFRNAVVESQIESQDAIQIIRLLSYDSVLLRRYMSPEKVGNVLEIWQQDASKSRYYDNTKTLEQNIQRLRVTYPKLWDYTRVEGERLEALRVLEGIFIQDTQKSIKNMQDTYIAQRSVTGVEKRITEHIQKLSKIYNKTPREQDTVSEIGNYLGILLNKLQEDPVNTYGQILFYLHQQNSRLNTNIQQQQQNTQIANTQQQQKQTPLEQAILNLENTLLKTNNNNNDISSVVNPEYTQIEQLAKETESRLRESTNLNLAEWVDGKKTIYDSEAPIQPLINTLSIATGALSTTWLYLLYSGTATYTTLLGLGGLSFIGLRNIFIQQQNNNQNYIRRIHIYKDGQTLDVFVENQGKIKKIDNLSISEFNVVSGNTLIKEVVDSNTHKRVRVTPNSLRQQHIGTNSKFVLIRDTLYLLPLNYRANHTALQDILAGRNISNTQLI